MRNFELINELMKYPAYCEVNIEIGRGPGESGETVMQCVGLCTSELSFMEDFGDFEITLHPYGEVGEKERYAYRKDAAEWMVRLDAKGQIIKKGVEERE